MERWEGTMGKPNKRTTEHDSISQDIVHCTNPGTVVAASQDGKCQVSTFATSAEPIGLILGFE